MIHACLPVEARVLAGMITDAKILSLCDDVESADFVDMRHVAVFNAIRNAQTRGEVSQDTVLEAIQQYALDHGAFGMLETVNRAFIDSLIAKAPPGGLRTIRKDIERLRKDREFRESLYVAHAAALKASRG